MNVLDSIVDLIIIVSILLEVINVNVEMDIITIINGNHVKI